MVTLQKRVPDELKSTQNTVILKLKAKQLCIMTYINIGTIEIIILVLSQTELFDTLGF